MSTDDVDTKTFSKLIEDLIVNKPMPYMDAILACAVRLGLEPEYAARLVNKNIKSKLEAEAGELNLLRDAGDRLPI